MALIRKQVLSFLVTTSCNLACKYCYTNKYEGAHRNQTLDLDFAKAGIDDFFAQSTSRHIRFFGAGEPTTKFELMRNIYDYSYKKSGGSLTAEIQTNGIFSREIADWLAGNVDIIWISSDGPPKVQDRYRVTANGEPTSKILGENIRYLVKNPKDLVGIRSTITEETINMQKEIVDYFSSLGIAYIWSDPLFLEVGEKTDYKLFDYKLYADKYLEAREYAESLGIFYGTFLASNFDEEIDYYCRACLPLPHLTTDGYVSACDMALFGELKDSEKQMSPFIYGKWDKISGKIIYFTDKMEHLQSRKADNMPGCKGCSALKHCAGYCLGEVTNESGDMFGKKPQVCESIRYLLKAMRTDLKKYRYPYP